MDNNEIIDPALFADELDSRCDEALNRIWLKAVVQALEKATATPASPAFYFKQRVPLPSEQFAITTEFGEASWIL